MKEYKISKIHCVRCAENIETQLRELENKKKINLNYEDGIIRIPNDVDLEAVKKLLDVHKVFFLNKAIEDQEYAHSHQHHHDTSSKNISIVFFMNIIFSISEFIFGTLFNSTAILTDAIHDFGDALSIGLAWIFEKISTKEANRKYTFGHLRFSLLGALITAIVLITGSIFSIVRTLPRIINPVVVNYSGMFWLAIAAMAMNIFGTWLLKQGSSKNEKVLSLHLLEDVLGWAAILIVSIVLRFKDWYILDPLLSLALAIFILYHAVPSFLETMNIFLEAVPENVDLEKLSKQINSIKEIHAMTHFHFWSIDGQENATTVTVYTESENIKVHEAIREQIRNFLINYNCSHSTIEVVYDPDQIVA